MKVLYSFPNKIGAGRVCYTAWEQVRGLVAAGVEVLAMPIGVLRELPPSVTVQSTLARGKFRIPQKLLGRRGSFILHDKIVASRLKSLVGQIDLIHCWPLGCLETIREAKRLGIPTLLERPNSHTRTCCDIVAAECRRVGIAPHPEYVRSDRSLRREEAEYAEADYLLCPSEFAAQSFVDRGFSESRILRHAYGFDENRYFPDAMRREKEKKFIALFVGVDPVRKGLHFALEAWLYSPAIRDGIFLIAGELPTEFKRKFKELLSDPSIVQLGFRKDVPHLMRTADVLLLPSVEEGSPLVCCEAMGSGAVPLASSVCRGVCRHLENSLLHDVGDVTILREHLTALYRDRELLSRLREGTLRSRYELTWTAAGHKLAAVMGETIAISKDANHKIETHQ